MGWRMQQNTCRGIAQLCLRWGNTAIFWAWHSSKSIVLQNPPKYIQMLSPFGPFGAPCVSMFEPWYGSYARRLKSFQVWSTKLQLSIIELFCLLQSFTCDLRMQHVARKVIQSDECLVTPAILNACCRKISEVSGDTARLQRSSQSRGGPRWNTCCWWSRESSESSMQVSPSPINVNPGQIKRIQTLRVNWRRYPKIVIHYLYQNTLLVPLKCPKYTKIGPPY